MLVSVDFFTDLKTLSVLRNRVDDRCADTVESLEAFEQVVVDIELLSSVLDFEVVCDHLKEKNEAAEHRFRTITREMEVDLEEANKVVNDLKECTDDVLPDQIATELNRMRRKLEARIPVISNLSIFVTMLYPDSVVASAASGMYFGAAERLDEQPRMGNELRDRLQRLIMARGLNDEVFALFMTALGANDSQGSSSAGLNFIDPSKLSQEDFQWHQVYAGIEYTCPPPSTPKNVVLKVFDLKDSVFGFQEALRLDLFRASPNIVTLEGVTVVRVRKEDRLALVMDYAGIDLHAYLEQNPNLSSEERMDLIEGVIKGVMQMHAKNCVHGDLSLKNIFYDPDLKRVQIGDFRAARTSIAETFKHSIQTTPQYCAPEFINSVYKGDCTDVKALMAADVYSVGVIAWEVWHNELVYNPNAYVSGPTRDDVDGLSSTPRQMFPASNALILEPATVEEEFLCARQRGYLNQQHEADKVSYSVSIRGFKSTTIESQVKMVFEQTLRKKPNERKTIHEVYRTFMKTSFSNVLRVRVDQCRRHCSTAYALLFLAALAVGCVSIVFLRSGDSSCGQYYDNTESVGSTRIRQSTCFANTVVSSEALGPAAGYRMRVATRGMGAGSDLTSFDACLDPNLENNVAVIRTQNSSFDVRCTAPVTFSKLVVDFPSPQNSTLELNVVSGTVELQLIHRHTHDYGKVLVNAGFRIRYDPWKPRNMSVSFASESASELLIQWGLTSAFIIPRYSPLPTATPTHTMSTSLSSSRTASETTSRSETTTATRSISPSPSMPMPASIVNNERSYQQRAGVSCGLRSEGGEVGSAGYVIAWESTLESGATDVLFKIYSPDNVVLVNDTAAPVGSPLSKIYPNVACLYPEGFVIGWYAGASHVANRTVYGRLFDNGGHAISQDVQLSTTLANDQTRATFAAYTDQEGFVASWVSRVEGTISNVMTRLFTNSTDMTFAGDPMVVNVVTDEYNGVNSVCTIPGTSDFVVAWTRGTIRGQREIVSRKRSNGAFGSEIQVSGNRSDNVDGDIACLDGGNIAFTWMLPDASSNGVAYKVYDDDLQVVHAETFANTVQDGLQRYPGIGALSDGNFAIVWSSKKDAECSANEDVILRLFSSTGEPLSTDLLVYDAGLVCPDGSIVGFRPSVSRLLGTEFQVIWSVYNTSDSADVGMNNKAGAGDVMRRVYSGV